VKIAFDHTDDDTILVLDGVGEMDFKRDGGLQDPASSGGTGDIKFTTVNTTANDSYTIKLDIGI